MRAQLAQPQGPLNMIANQGRYNLDTQRIAIDGPVRVAGGDGYRLATRDVLVDLKQRKLASSGPVAGELRLGQFQAQGDAAWKLARLLRGQFIGAGTVVLQKARFSPMTHVTLDVFEVPV